jgi:hypothetical protein
MLARQIAIGFGIAIILPLLIHYGVSTFYPKPQFSFASAQLPSNATADERKQYADQQRQRQEADAGAAKQFARVLLIVAAPIGIAAIFIGAYLPLQAVGTGLILGGIFTVTWGYWGYW